MTLDILFVARNRLEFTRQSLAALERNTNWSLVRYLWLCDDGSTDDTADLMDQFECFARVRYLSKIFYGSPAAVMNRFVRMADPPGAPELFAKIDNDVIVPPGWLDDCARVMEAHPELDLLGIEPPASRVPHYAGGRQSPTPELNGTVFTVGAWGSLGFAPCDSIGGIGLMRTRCFLENEPLRPHSTYGGFTEWMLEHPRVTKGWIVPPLGCFLLDRMPMEPWVGLSKEYEAKGWQRSWQKYPADSKLWAWWHPVEGLGVAAASAPPPSGAGASKSGV